MKWRDAFLGARASLPVAFPLVPMEGLDPLQSAMAKDDAATDHLLGAIAVSETRWNAIGDMIDGLVKR